MEVSLAELESMAISAGLDSLVAGDALAPALWIKYEAEVRSAHSAAAAGLRQHGGERFAEVLRLLEVEEQTRCQAFQGVLMGEVHAPVYQNTVRSILEKLLAKLETCSYDATLYRGAAQCLSEYMSALNHHCDTIALPSPEEAALCGLGAIAEAEDERIDTTSIASEDSLLSDSTQSSHQSRSIGSIASDSNRPTDRMDSHLSTEGPLRAGVGLSLHPISDELRKQRRRESNRNASSKYRSKKTATLSTLMADNAALRQQVAQLSSQSAVLSAENKLLKQQVAFMQGILQGPLDSTATAATAATAPAATPPTGAHVGNLSLPLPAQPNAHAQPQTQAHAHAHAQAQAQAQAQAHAQRTLAVPGHPRNQQTQPAQQTVSGQQRAPHSVPAQPQARPQTVSMHQHAQLAQQQSQQSQRASLKLDASQLRGMPHQPGKHPLPHPTIELPWERAYQSSNEPFSAQQGFGVNL